MLARSSLATLLALARQHAALREESFDAIIVLACGVDSSVLQYQRFMPSSHTGMHSLTRLVSCATLVDLASGSGRAEQS